MKIIWNTNNPFEFAFLSLWNFLKWSAPRYFFIIYLLGFLALIVDVIILLKNKEFEWSLLIFMILQLMVMPITLLYEVTMIITSPVIDDTFI